MNKKSYNNHILDHNKLTEKQFEDCMKNDFIITGALMPDAHLGYSAPIGSVLKTKDHIVPSWIGFDIGCGVIGIKLSEDKNVLNKILENSKEIFEKVNLKIPMGVGKKNSDKKRSKNSILKFDNLISKLKKNTNNIKLWNLIKQNGLYDLGTLGSGNHFIELSKNEKGNESWLIIHSGSRNIGNKVAKYFMEKTNENEKDKISLKSDSKVGKEYLNYLDFCLEFATLNRLEMGKVIFEILKDYVDITFEVWTNKTHNHCVKEKNGEFYHRKGATSAKLDERGIIPANMKDGCYLVKGKGSKIFLNSSSHGAGRKYSRTDAFNKLDFLEFENQMKEIVSNKSKKLLDEAPNAYKNINEIMDKQKESVEIVKKLIPIINWKGI